MRKILSKDNFETYRSPFELRHIKLFETEKSYQIGAGRFSGSFYYDPTDITTADNVGIVIVNAAGQRLKRQPGEFLSNRWFGSQNLFFDSTADVNAKMTAQRVVGMRCLIKVSGVVKEYWYAAGTDDPDLVLKGGGSGDGSPTDVPEDYDIDVTPSGGLINVGDTTFVIEEHIGWLVRLYRKYAKQSQKITEPSYFGFDASTGEYAITPAADEGESFQLEAYKRI